MPYSKDVIAESILLELLLSVSAETDEQKIISKSLRFYLRKVHCFAVAIFQYDGYELIRKGLMPVKLSEINELNQAVATYADLIDKEGLPLVFPYKGENAHYQFFRLRDYGAIVLLRRKKLADSIVRELLPVVDNLGKSLSLARNIRLRKIAEERTKNVLEDLQMLQQFVENTRDALQVSDEYGEIVYLNDEASSRIGVDWDRKEKLFVWDFEPYFRKEGVWEQHIKTLRTEGQTTVETITQNLNTKEEIAVELTVNTSVINGALYVIAVSRDITERKKAELELSRKEKLLVATSSSTNMLLGTNNIYDSIANSLQILGEAIEVDRSYLFINKFDTKLELLCSLHSEWNSGRAEPQLLNPEFQDWRLSNYSELATSLLKKETFIVRSKDLEENSLLRLLLESHSTYSVAVLPIYKNEVFWGFVGFDACTDEKKWSEAEVSILKTYVSAIESALDKEDKTEGIESLALFPSLNPNPVIRTTLEGELILQNPAAEGIRLLRWEGKIISKKQFLINIAARLSADRPKLKVEIFHEPREYFSVDCVFVKERSEINLYFNRITKLKENEKLLKLAKIKAEESERAKEQFIANMSHEIRTPLHAIKGLSDILKKSQLSTEDRKLVEQIRQSGGHLQSLINNILDFSKISAGELKLNITTFSFRAMFEQLKAIVASIAEEKGLNLYFIIDPDIAQSFLGDELRLRQIFLNLISNALKFTEEGFVRIKALVKESSTKNQSLSITITDTGIGMDQSFQERLFEKFSQEDASLDRKHSGTGLGMAITKELVELMGGTIQVNSIKDVGTSFSILLPLEINQFSPINSMVEDIEPEKLANKKILVVEDNEINFWVVSSLLSDHGFTIYKATNGKEAVQHPLLKEVDLIFMDLQMPVMDGFAATRKLRKEMNIKTPIIALTANAIKTEIDRCFELGMNDYVLKPFDEDHLLNIIAKNINAKVERKELYSINEIRNLSNNSNRFMLKILSLFIEKIPPIIEELIRAFYEGDLQQVKAIAHKIKPNYQQLGIKGLEQEFILLNSEISAETYDPNSYLEAIEKIDKITKEIVIEFEELISSI